MNSWQEVVDQRVTADTDGAEFLRSYTKNVIRRLIAAGVLIPAPSFSDVSTETKKPFRREEGLSSEKGNS